MSASKRGKAHFFVQFVACIGSDARVRVPFLGEVNLHAPDGKKVSHPWSEVVTDLEQKDVSAHFHKIGMVVRRIVRVRGGLSAWGLARQIDLFDVS